MIIMKRDVFIIELNSVSLRIRCIRLSKIIFIQNHELLPAALCPRSKRIYDIQSEFISDTTRRISIRYFPTRLRSLFRAIPLFAPSAAFNQTTVFFRENAEIHNKYCLSMKRKKIVRIIKIKII